ncbi:ribosome maturation factor RimP [Secundilactobacillus malefermentans]|uniref:Ribosome maturation factor RimP n=1 Tax=Secundilactobacillus malefermentans TaxID=176292 RepID=A0A4R5NRV7_9LACO|nr:ribosome maturation factor RimP [Secundilactobacillus malefermentans]TDG79667.1 hypothetical protein C5L31_001578 [Secundilactobacillus malefermentans]
MSSVVETVTQIVSPIVDAHQFELVNVEFVKEGDGWYLRVYIDKPGGITIEECAMVSDELSEKLDAMDPDPIPQAYFLEISSPGAERPLLKEKDYQNSINKYVHVSLYQQIKGEKVFEGYLLSVSDAELTLKINQKGRISNLVIPREKIAKARLAIKF